MKTTVSISRQWANDGDVLQIQVSAGAGYPDQLAEAKATALALYYEALGVTLAAEKADDDT